MEIKALTDLFDYFPMTALVEGRVFPVDGS